MNQLLFAKALAQELGPRRGAEELTQQLNRVYGGFIRASTILEAAFKLLQERAARLDHEARRQFLENVPAHRDLLAAWEVENS